MLETKLFGFLAAANQIEADPIQANQIQANQIEANQAADRGDESRE